MAPKDKTTELPEAPAPHSLFSTKRNQEIPTLPTVHDKTKLDVRYPLIEPHAYAHLYYDQTTNEIVYKVEEPQLDPQEKQLLETIERGIGEIINISFINVKAKNAVIEYLELTEFSSGRPISIYLTRGIPVFIMKSDVEGMTWVKVLGEAVTVKDSPEEIKEALNKLFT